MHVQKNEWTEAHLRVLYGQPESLTLEFIAPQVVQKPTALVRTLSKDISAFANAEGGTIVIGMNATRSRPPVAVERDVGLDPAQLSLEQLQSLASACVSPPLPDLTCCAVPVADASEARMVYVISVPKGYAAHQANDYVYYTRNGFTTEALPHHLVRLLMLHGSAPHAQLEIGNCDILNKDQHDEYRFDLVVNNIGPTTLRDFLIELRIDINDPGVQMWAPTMFVDDEEAIRDELKSVESMLEIGDSLDEHERHDILHGPGIPFQSGDRLRCSFRRIMQLLYQAEGKQIFPQDRIIFPGGKWLIESIPCDTVLRAYAPLLHWTLYVDNAEPCSGTIDMADPFEAYQQTLSDFY